MLKIIAVMAGGSLGAASRYILFLFVQRFSGPSFPAGTMAANLLGCFTIGLLWSFFEGSRLTNEWRLFIFTGFLGGFTTFSTFARETIQFFKAGEPLQAIAYVLVSNIIGLTMVVCGFFLYHRLIRF